MVHRKEYGQELKYYSLSLFFENDLCNNSLQIEEQLNRNHKGIPSKKAIFGLKIESFLKSIKAMR